MNDNYQLNSLNLTIREVAVGKRKLTKALFAQIEPAPCFTKEAKFAGDAIIGYVKDKEDRYLLWTLAGKLRKSSLTRYYKLKNDPTQADLDDSRWFLRSFKLNLTDQEGLGHHTLEEQERYGYFVKKIQAFLDSLVDRQVFL